MADKSSKVSDGVSDELFLGDGFSIIDSTTAKPDPVISPKKEKESVDGEEVSDQSKEIKAGGVAAVNKKTEKKSDSVQNEKKLDSIKVEKKSEQRASPVENSKNDKQNEILPIKEETIKVENEVAEGIDKIATKVNGQSVDVKSGSTLIITTEEDLDADLNSTVDKSCIEKDKIDLEKKKKSEGEKVVTKSNSGEDNKEKAEIKKNGDLWVSNITRHVKATDLKKHFSRMGKVLTAKIVTNGKSFFGYILMENAEVANKCVKSLNGSLFDKRKIAVSKQRPDAQKKTKPEKKVEKKEEVKEKAVESAAEQKTEKTESSTKKADKEKITVSSTKKSDEKRVELLKRDISRLKSEVAKLRKYFTSEQIRCRIETSKNRRLERELKDAELKLREERRKFDRDRELFEKNTRTDRMKLESDRANIKKELEEVKKVREYLKRKLDEDQARNSERRARAQSPYTYSSKRYREDGAEKNVKYIEERARTPTPPKLSSRKRSPNDNSYLLEKERRPTVHHYDISEGFEKESSRHGTSVVIQNKPPVPAAPRNIWPSAFHQEVWRMGPAASSTPFSTEQYPRQTGYHSPSGGKGSNYSQQREFNKRDHYGNVRKY